MSKIKVGDVAKVFRCNLKREAAPELDEPVIWERARIPVWNELRIDNIDPDTGFVRAPLPAVRVSDDPEKEAVRTTDTLFCFQGMPERIARPGMLLYDWAVIPSRTIGIIRPTKIDPVWLFYYMADALKTLTLEVRDFRSFLHLDKVKNIEIDGYDEKDIAKINDIHKRMVSSFKTYYSGVMKRQSDIRAIRLKMDIL